MKRAAILVLFVILMICPLPVWAEGSHIFKIGEDVTIDSGTRVNNVIAIGGQVTVSGTVDGSVVAIGNSVVLTGRSVVGGNVVTIGGIIVMGKSSEVHGTLTEINSSNISDVVTTILSDEWEGWSWIQAVFSVILFLCTLIVGLILVALMPAPIRAMSEEIRANSWKVLLWGILGLILVVPLAVLLTVSVIGIVLIPLEIIIVACATLMGLIAVSQFIGQQAYALFKRSGQHMIRQTFWGLVIIWLIGWIPVIGWMFKVFAITIGLGAAISTRFGIVRRSGLPPKGEGDSGQSEPQSTQDIGRENSDGR